MIRWWNKPGKANKITFLDYLVKVKTNECITNTYRLECERADILSAWIPGLSPE